MVSLWVKPGSRKWTWVSMRPGATTSPVASRTVSPERFSPILRMVPSSTRRSITPSIPEAGSSTRPFLISNKACPSIIHFHHAITRDKALSRNAAKRSEKAPFSIELPVKIFPFTKTNPLFQRFSLRGQNQPLNSSANSLEKIRGTIHINFPASSLLNELCGDGVACHGHILCGQFFQ